MAVKPENSAISPSAARDASASKAPVDAPTMAAAQAPPPAPAPKAKERTVVPPPKPPPPDTRTPQELDALAKAFMADGPAPKATAPETTEAEPVKKEQESTEEIATDEEHQEAEETDPTKTASEESAADAGPEWVVNALKDIPEELLSPALRKRLEKMAGESKERNGKIKTLETEVAARKEAETKTAPVVVQATLDEPLAHITTEAQLAQTVRAAKDSESLAEAWIEWCGDNREGGEVTPGKQESYLDAAAVKAKLQEARYYAKLAKAQISAEPSRKEWLKKHAAANAAVVKDRPSLGDKLSDDYQVALDLLSQPLAARPDHMQIAADYLAGKQLREEKANGIQHVTLQGNGKPKPLAAQAPKNRDDSTVATASPGASAAPVRAAGAPEDLGTLRARAKAGDESASNKLASAFLESAK